MSGSGHGVGVANGGACIPIEAGVDRVGSPSPTAALWSQLIRPGDVGAFDAVYRTYAPDLIATVRRYVDSRELAEEVVQDAFLSGWTARQQWTSPDALAGYLFTAARHRAVDLLRRRRVETRWAERAAVDQAIDEATATSPLDDEVYAAELAARVDQAVDTLPERRRLIFLLYRDRRMTYADIAAHLGLSIKTIETQMSRAYRTLREALVSLREP